MGISHLGINCASSEFDKVVAFYLAALKPLGYREMMRPVENAVGLGNGFGPDFWITAVEGCDKVSIDARKQMGFHFAFDAKGEFMGRRGPGFRLASHLRSMNVQTRMFWIFYLWDGATTFYLNTLVTASATSCPFLPSPKIFYFSPCAGANSKAI